MAAMLKIDGLLKRMVTGTATCCREVSLEVGGRRKIVTLIGRQRCGQDDEPLAHGDGVGGERKIGRPSCFDGTGPGWPKPRVSGRYHPRGLRLRARRAPHCARALVGGSRNLQLGAGWQSKAPARRGKAEINRGGIAETFFRA